MRNSKYLLAAIIALWATFAAAGYLPLLQAGLNGGSGGTVPVFSENYLTSSTSALTFSRAGQAMMYDSTGKLTYAPNNIIQYSEDVSNAYWTKAALATPTSSGTSPRGATAWTITPTASNVFHGFYKTALTSPVGRLMISADVKANGYNYALIEINSAGPKTVISYDLSGGTVSGYYTGGGGYTDLTANASISSLGSGWYRISLYADFTSAISTQVSFGVYNVAGNFATTAFSGDTTSGILTTAMQVEFVTYETTSRTYNATTSAAYYGPRFEYGLESTTKTGWLIEGEARTNLVLWNRDLTNAAWVKSASMAAAKDQTGIDGVANSASKLTASAANQTCLQSITSASATRITSVFVKRISGSGTIEITQDATDTAGTGATWTTVTVTSSWTRVNLTGASVTNPIVGFRIVTSGDEIAVDFVQTETYIASASGAWYSSPIYTTTASVARAAEIVNGATTLFSYNNSTGTLIAEFYVPDVDQNVFLGGFNSSGISDNVFLYKGNPTITAPGKYVVGYNRDTVATILSSGVQVAGSPFRVGLRYNTGGGATGLAISVNGGAPSTGQVRSAVPTTFRLCYRDGATAVPMGHARMVYYYATDLGDTEFQAKTTVGAAP